MATPQHKSTPRWASLTEAALYVGVNQRTLRRMIAFGQLTGHRIGPRLIRVDLNEIDAVLMPVRNAGNL